MNDIWFERIYKNPKIKKIKRKDLKRMVVASLEHAFLVHYDDYQETYKPIKGYPLLKIICRVLGVLWNACEQNLDLNDIQQMRAELESGITDDHEYTGPWCPGFETLLCGMVDALFYFSNHYCARSTAMNAIGDAYMAVYQKAFPEELEQNPLPESMDYGAKLLAYDEAEANNEKCKQEIEFQESCIDTILAGKKLEPSMPPKWYRP